MQKPIPYYRRYHGYDYSRGASLFITISTDPRRALFGRVENAAVVLSELGRLVLESMQAIPRFNPGIALFEHVLMPDHLHMNLRIEAGLAEPLQILGAAIRRFKTYTTTLARKMHGEIPHVVSRIGDAVRAGFVVVSGFISPGEVAVRDMLLENREARFIHILPSCMTLRHRPDSRYLEPLAEGRFLEIAQGNDETEFGRGACLALNEEIRAMALAGEGGALYWKQEGPEYTRGGARDSGHATRGGARDSGWETQ